MKIALVKEGKTPPDERVALSPTQCKEITENFPAVHLVVQKSDIRRFKNSEYESLGIEVVESLEDCDVLLGVKEVPINELITGKTYFYFSHTTKKQAYNRDLLKAMLDKNITMVDYEGLTNGSRRRLIGFGKYAGIVGCYNAFYAYGQRTNTFDLKRAYLCEDRAEMEGEFSKIKLPNDFKIIISGTGRVSTGAEEILQKIGIRRVSPKEMIIENFNEPVYAKVKVEHAHKRIDDADFTTQDFYNDPIPFVSTFHKFTKVADMYIACHYWDSRAPYVFTREEAKSPDFNLQVVADISCDIDGPIASTLRPSTIKDPLYGYDAQSEKEVDFRHNGAITVMAVDNLPCELPKDASVDFGREFIDKVLPHLIDDQDGIIERATICKNGDLTPQYGYLRDYVDGEVTA